MSRSFSADKYKLYKKSGKRFFNNRNQNHNQDEERVRLDDPTTIGNLLNEVIAHKGWESNLSQSDLFNNWENVVGKEISEHSTPITILDGVLTIQTTSTAWAAQLNALQIELLKSIQASAGGALVNELKIIPPRSRSWKKGPLSARDGRGPRDTYI